MDRNGSKWSKTDKNRQKQTEIYSNGQNKGQKGTEMDRNDISGQKQTGGNDRDPLEKLQTVT